MSEHAKKASELFRSGLNCSQAVVVAFADELGLDTETAMKISCGFGGGIGRMRSVCGAFSGAVMIAGFCGSSNKAEVYETVRKFADEFKEQNGSLICSELLGITKPENSPDPAPRTESYYKKRPCVQIVSDTAELIEKYLNNI